MRKTSEAKSADTNPVMPKPDDPAAGGTQPIRFTAGGDAGSGWHYSDAGAMPVADGGWKYADADAIPAA